MIGWCGSLSSANSICKCRVFYLMNGEWNKLERQLISHKMLGRRQVKLWQSSCSLSIWDRHLECWYKLMTRAMSIWLLGCHRCFILFPTVHHFWQKCTCVQISVTKLRIMVALLGITPETLIMFSPRVFVCLFVCVRLCLSRCLSGRFN